ncbi:MAG: hypothetical protein ACI855_002581, partial [Myxococcota bacterium]
DIALAKVQQVLLGLVGVEEGSGVGRRARMCMKQSLQFMNARSGE